VKVDREQSGGVSGGRLGDAECEELARLRKAKAEMAGQHAAEKAVWGEEFAELEVERDDAPMFVKPPWWPLCLVRGLR
jgi:hypothetical protein